MALFLILYGFFRFFVEFFREPDAQLGFILGPFTMGQVLCGGDDPCGRPPVIYLQEDRKSHSPSDRQSNPFDF